MEQSREELCNRLNEQTGKLGWAEIEKHFARGVVITVSQDLDLIEVAVAIVEDNMTVMDTWMKETKVGNADAKDAMDWVKRQPEFWAVVVTPWLLIQEIG